MMRYFWIREERTPLFNGSFDATHQWRLPGVKCHVCGVTWGGAGHQYPEVDLSRLPERARFVRPWPVSVEEFTQLRELVRPLLPTGAPMPPGTHLGPLEGTASGRFGPLTSQGDLLWVVRRDALEQLQSAGLRGLLGSKTELRFRQKEPPELLELQIEPRGCLHPACLPSDLQPPCDACGRVALRLPEDLLLDAASLPEDRDVFRVGDAATVIIGTERLVEAVKRLGLAGMVFREVPTR
ncbi:double-CXXCG motif protein [Myxococcus hansupus]|uniref:SitI6 family double-CXXCG motif immunity protein n=1 Tax=Pseudomyxococcus hansupus TaxID=1297742 RepID=UPI0003AF0393|nr:double-CXXCG motif protein [Myxococcus hansupus]